MDDHQQSMFSIMFIMFIIFILFARATSGWGGINIYRDS